MEYVVPDNPEPEPVIIEGTATVTESDKPARKNGRFAKRENPPENE